MMKMSKTQQLTPDPSLAFHTNPQDASTTRVRRFQHQSQTCDVPHSCDAGELHSSVTAKEMTVFQRRWWSFFRRCSEDHTEEMAPLHQLTDD